MTVGTVIGAATRSNRIRMFTGVALACMILAVSAFCAAAEPAPIAGGLTDLPAVVLSANLANNPGFENTNGSLPVGWSAGGGWSLDSTVKHSGDYSYRWSTGSPTASQSVQVKAGVYNFSGWVRTDLATGNTGIRLQLDLRPAINQWFTTPVINGVRDWTYYEIANIVIPQDMTISLKLENYAGASGTAWFDDITLTRKMPPPVEVFMLYPNYRGMLFDDQSQLMKFDVTVTPPDDSPASSFTVTGRLKEEATGAVVLTQTWPGAASFTAEIDGSAMQPGIAYLVEFSIDSDPVYTYPAYRVSKVPASARSSMNISFDEQNRLLIRGEPRFLLGVYDSGGGYSPNESFWEEQIWSPTGPRRLEGLDINFYLNYWMGEAPADAMLALMNNLQDHGVMYLQTGNCFSNFPAGSNFLINSSDEYVRTIGAHPGSAGYYTADECIPGLVEGVFEQYKRLRSLDPDSMTFAALFGNPDLRLWRDAADVIATDPYPLFGAEPAGGYPHNRVAEWTIAAREAVKDSRPVMTVLQFFKFTSQGRWPTRAEMRNHAYMAIVEGAKGLWWWSVGIGAGALNTTATCPVAGSWCTFQQERMDDLRAVVGEIASLEPVLLADDAPGALTGNSNPTAVKTKVKVTDGVGYIFAYNNTPDVQSATFTWNAPLAGVTVFNEGRTAAVSDASFTDSFGPYEAHVYVVQAVEGGGNDPGGEPGGPGGGPGLPGGPDNGPPGFGNEYTARKALSPPAIDGDLSEFADAPAITLTSASGSGVYRVLYDDDALYVAAEVTDEQLETAGAGEDGNIEQGDSLQFMIDTLRDRPGNMRADDYMFIVDVAGVRADQQGTKRAWDGTWTSGVQVAGTVDSGSDTDSGYRIEVRIPWSTIGVTGAAPGSQLGFNVVMNDRDAGKWERTVWSGPPGAAAIHVVQHWGTLTLGSPLPDTRAPAVSITAPAEGEIVSGTVTVEANATDNVGVVGVQFKLDGVNLGAEDTEAPFTVNWDTTTAAEGSHTLTAVARDAAGLTTTSEAVVVIVRNAALEYTVRRTSTAPAVDGDLSEYSGAPAITLTNENGTHGEYRLLYDADALYVAAEVADVRLETQGHGEDGAVYREDTLEFMIDTLFDKGPARQADDYKFFVSISGARRDEQGTDVTWEGAWESSVQAIGTINDGSDTDTGYRIEVRIPWSTLGLAGPPEQGSRMGFNLVMNDLSSGSWVWETWAPEAGGINVPDNWGALIFGSSVDSAWSSQDVGDVGLPGSFTESDGTFTVQASGADIWGPLDEFHFVFQPWSGDVTVVARVTGLERTHCCSAKAGVMIRESLDANSRHALVTLETGGSVTFLRRTTTGGNTAFTAGGAASTPVWVKLVRSGNTFEGYRSNDGVDWTLVASISIPMNAEVYVGLAVTSHNDTTLTTATFDNVSVH